jgi:hypothetical protein
MTNTEIKTQYLNAYRDFVLNDDLKAYMKAVDRINSSNLPKEELMTHQVIIGGKDFTANSFIQADLNTVFEQAKEGHIFSRIFIAHYALHYCNLGILDTSYVDHIMSWVDEAKDIFIKHPGSPILSKSKALKAITGNFLSSVNFRTQKWVADSIHEKYRASIMSLNSFCLSHDIPSYQRLSFNFKNIEITPLSRPQAEQIINDSLDLWGMIAKGGVVNAAYKSIPVGESGVLILNTTKLDGSAITLYEGSLNTELGSTDNIPSLINSVRKYLNGLSSKERNDGLYVQLEFLQNQRE